MFISASNLKHLHALQKMSKLAFSKLTHLDIIKRRKVTCLNSICQTITNLLIVSFFPETSTYFLKKIHSVSHHAFHIDRIFSAIHDWSYQEKWQVYFFEIPVWFIRPVRLRHAIRSIVQTVSFSTEMTIEMTKRVVKAQCQKLKDHMERNVHQPK